MRTRRRSTQALAVMALLASTSAIHAGDADHRQHAAHQHGHGTLQVVTEGETLVVELIVPAVNVVGFEHSPRTQVERQQARAALENFQKAETLFVLPAGASCRIQSATVRLTGMDLESAATGSVSQAKHDHGHGSSSAHDHAGDGHSELQGRYRYRCTAPEALDTMQVTLLEHLSGMASLEAQVVTPTVQTAVEVRPGADRLTLIR